MFRYNTNILSIPCVCHSSVSFSSTPKRVRNESKAPLRFILFLIACSWWIAIFSLNLMLCGMQHTANVMVFCKSRFNQSALVIVWSGWPQTHLWSNNKSWVNVSSGIFASYSSTFSFQSEQLYDCWTLQSCYWHAQQDEWPNSLLTLEVVVGVVVLMFLLCSQLVCRLATVGWSMESCGPIAATTEDALLVWVVFFLPFWLEKGKGCAPIRGGTLS
jgi:hypothetical protein